MQTKVALFSTLKFLFIFCLIVLCNSLHGQNIYTVSGNYNYYNDGFKRTSSPTHPCYGICTDKAGNLIFSEAANATLRRVDINGITTIIAGNRQEQGYSGDNKSATEALLGTPTGIAIDAAGNIYFCDQGDNCVRKINTQGIITTFAGNGIGGFSGDGGLAINANLLYPHDVAIDKNGNVFISDEGNERIRVVNSNGIINTYAGNGIAGFGGDNVLATGASFNDPQGIAIDKNENLFVADANNNRIRKIDSNQIITTYAGNGQTSNVCNAGLNNDTTSATKVSIGPPFDVDVDGSNNIYFVANSCGIYSVTTDGKIHSIAISGSLHNISYNSKDSSIYYSTTYEDPCNGRIAAIIKLSLITKTSFNYVSTLYYQDPKSYYLENEPAGLSNLGDIAQIVFKKGNLFMADAIFYKIESINPKGILSTIAGNGKQGSNGYGDGGDALKAEFKNPTGVAADNSGNIFIADNGDNRIRKVNKSGEISTYAFVNYPLCLAIDDSSNLYVSTEDQYVYKIDTTGTKTVYAGNGIPTYNGDNKLAINASLHDPQCLYFDNTDRSLYIADATNNRIRKVNRQGRITTIAGNGSFGFSGDGGLAVDAAMNNPTGIIKDSKGNFFIADNNNYKIRKVDANGIIHTVAGGGRGDYFECDGERTYSGGYSGDGDSAIKASLNFPYSVAVNNNNNLFLSDRGNARIREILFNGIDKPIPFTSGIKQYINRPFDLRFDSYLICIVHPTGNYISSLNKKITTNVWVKNSLVYDSAGKPFVSRHYQLYPEYNNDISGSAKLIFYFTQAEFDIYNKNADTAYYMLPSNPHDSSGIKNVRLYGYPGKSADSSGLPNTYQTSPVIINPFDNDVVWNNTGKYWQVSFQTNLLGGFFIGTEKKPVSVADNENSSAANAVINIYPNPATDNIYISLPTNFLHKPVQLISVSGKIISGQIANTQTINFNIKNFASGVYLVRFADGEVKKVIVSKK